MGVGTLRCVVINVTDLQLAYKFWGAVTGLEVIGSETGWNDWLGYLGTKDPRKHEIILQRVDTSRSRSRHPTQTCPTRCTSTSPRMPASTRPSKTSSNWGAG